MRVGVVALVVTLLVSMDSAAVLAQGDQYALYRVEWRTSDGNYVIGEVRVNITVDDYGYVYTDDPAITNIIDYSLPDSVTSPEDALGMVVGPVTYYIGFYGDPDAISPDGTYHGEFEAGDNSVIVVDEVYDTTSNLLKQGIMKVVDQETGEVSAYVRFDLITTNFQGTASGGGTQGTEGEEQTATAASGGESAIRDGDWAEYRVSIDLRNDQDSYLRATATVRVVFHVDGGDVYTEVASVNIESLDTNVDNVTQEYLRQALEEMVNYGYVVPYADPASLPSDGVVTATYEGAEYREEYDPRLGVLKSSTMTVSSPGSGSIKFELADTSVAGLAPVTAGGLAPAGLPGGTAIVLAVIAAVVVAVVAVVAVARKRKRRPAQTPYQPYPQPPAPPPPPGQ